MSTLRYWILASCILGSMNVHASKLIVATPDLPSVVDPAKSLDVFSNSLVRQIHRTLFALSAGGEPRTDLIRDFRVSDNGLRLSMDLRTIRFHNGTPLTALVVKQSIERAIGLKTNGYLKFSCVHGFHAFTSGKMKRVDGIKATTPTSLEIVLTCPAPRLLHALADQRFAITLNHSFEVGLGPYRLGSKIAPNVNEIKLNKVEPTAGFDQVVYERIGFDKLRARIVKGESVISFLHPIGKDEASELKDIAVVNELMSWKNYLLVINAQRFSRIEARQELLNSIDRASLISRCFPDQVQDNNILPIGFPGYRKGLERERGKPTHKLPVASNRVRVYVLKGVGNESCVVKTLKDQFLKRRIFADIEIVGSDQAVTDWSRAKVDLLFMYLESEMNLDILQFFSEESNFFLGVRGSSKMSKALSRFASSRGIGEYAERAFEVQKIALSQFTALPLFVPRSFFIYSKDIEPIHTGMIPPTYLDLGKLKTGANR